MPSNNVILCYPLLLLPSIFPSIRVFGTKAKVCKVQGKPDYWLTAWGQGGSLKKLTPSPDLKDSMTSQGAWHIPEESDVRDQRTRPIRLGKGTWGGFKVRNVEDQASVRLFQLRNRDQEINYTPIKKESERENRRKKNLSTHQSIYLFLPALFRKHIKDTSNVSVLSQYSNIKRLKMRKVSNDTGSSCHVQGEFETYLLST